MPQKQKRSLSRKHVNKTVQTRQTAAVYEPDGVYFLKLVIAVLLGTLWLKFAAPISWNGFVVSALPLGLVMGLLLVNRLEKHQLDRKIFYAILLVVSIISLYVPAGIVI